MRKIFSVVLSLAILLSVSALANASKGRLFSSSRAPEDADIVGGWDLTIETPQGSRSSVLEIKKEGDKFTGMIKSERGERALNSVTLKGSDITFAMTVQAQGQDLVITYTGKVDNDSMKGTVSFGDFGEGDWSAKKKK